MHFVKKGRQTSLARQSHVLVGARAIGTRKIGVALLISQINRLGGDNSFDGHCELVCVKSNTISGINPYKVWWRSSLKSL